ncbi:MAG: Uncharacterised protein [Methanobacteriota archaeon]|mgnify:FL=1|nr:MAG: hypothetical protein CBE15_03040 [Euryarchaeota archaeon TMED255]CAI8205449.1 MAG: Uncharacterised protein [Euryarchaeota archaeon]|tara:strand:- start:10520 stop:10807 length:288 start_codon:yes stop_codon:yes gene_type:complete
MEALTVERVQEAMAITDAARVKATPLVVPGSEEEERLNDMLRMCDDYRKDASHFLEAGDLVRAFGAVYYAHAWVDAGVRIGWLDGHGDDELFTLP